jgi:excinuclease UvrABC nuclease subunit
MQLELTRYPFAGYAIKGAPDDPGVYLLWEAEELAYVGTAPHGATLRSRLTDHLEKRSQCDCKPTHYSWRLARNPKLLEKELLDQHRQKFERLPRCNKSAA